MNRYTEKREGGYFVPDENIRQAIQRLGELEGAYDDLISSQVLLRCQI